MVLIQTGRRPLPFGRSASASDGQTPKVEQRIRFCLAGDGARIAAATIGKGPFLLCAAPWFSHVELDARSPVWTHWLRELSRRHTYVRYDQRGCGLSDRTNSEFSFEAWVSDLEAVVGAVGLRRFAILGMSQGSAVAIAYAARHPERVSHLVLLGACARGALCRDRSAQERAEAQVLANLIRVGWGRENPAFRQVFTTMFIPEATLEHQRSFNDLQMAAISPEHAAASLEALQHLDVAPLAEAVRVPTLVFHARGDARVPFEEGRRLAATIPSARFVPLESRNHILMETEPAWKQFLATLQAFLCDGPASISDHLACDHDLTPAEERVLGLLARGLHNGAIATQLGKSDKTVRNQVSSILSKLRVHTRAEAVALARDAGIGAPPD